MEKGWPSTASTPTAIPSSLRTFRGTARRKSCSKLSNQDGGAGHESTPQRLYPLAWSADGKYLIYLTDGGDLNALELGADHKPVPLLHSQKVWSGAGLSPDGRWLAYASDESGVLEVYVVPFRIASDGTFSISGGKWQVSNNGGTQPKWRRDGKEMFFTNSSNNTLL